MSQPSQPLPRAALSRHWRQILSDAPPSRTLFALAGALVVVIAAISAGSLWHLRSIALTEAERESRNLNLVLADQTVRALEHVDFLLRTTSETLQRLTAEERLDAAGFERRMQDLRGNASQIRGLIIADRDGTIRYRSAGQASAYTIADRSYFARLRDDGGLEPLISEPVEARGNGGRVISIARRLTTPAGAFDGIVAAAVDPTYFYDPHRALELRAASAIALWRDDGTCLVQYGRTGGEHCDAPAPRHAVFAAAPTGLYREDGPDGAARLVSYQRIGSFPLVSTISMPLDTILAEWRRQEYLVAFCAIVGSVMLGTLMFLLAKEVGRREALGDALRHNEERFRNFAEASSDWFWEQDEDLRFVYFSRAPGNYLEMPRPTYVGLTADAIIAGVDETTWLAHKADLAARRPFRDFRYKVVAPDGSDRYVSINGKPLFDAAARFRGYAGNARDVTDEIAAASRLVEAKAEAEAASRAKSDFLAVMSHELRTPLNAVIGFSELISREILGPVGVAKYREYAGDILAAGRHLLGLIGNILDMSKIEARKMDLADETVDLGGLIADCARIVDGQASDAGVVLLMGCPAALPCLRGEAIRLKQILLNLLSNAIKFTAPGGNVTLTATPAADGGIALAVADTGIGMTEEELAVALQPFRQVESARSRKYQGTGLGLPLAKALAELHGGSLELRSTPGVGTIVTVTLPPDRILPTPLIDRRVSQR